MFRADLWDGDVLKSAVAGDGLAEGGIRARGLLGEVDEEFVVWLELDGGLSFWSREKGLLTLNISKHSSSLNLFCTQFHSYLVFLILFPLNIYSIMPNWRITVNWILNLLPPLSRYRSKIKRVWGTSQTLPLIFLHSHNRL